MLCGNCPGKSLKGEGPSKTVYVGHRQLCRESCYLRKFGQTRRCCPSNFFDPEVKTKFSSLPIVDNERSVVLKRSHELCLADYQKAENEQQHPNRGVWLALNKETMANDDIIYDSRIFSDALYYPFCDLREKPASYDSKKRERDYKNTLATKTPNKPLHGVKGPTLMANLVYFNLFDQFMWDSSHAISNNIKQIISFWKGTCPGSKVSSYL